MALAIDPWLPMTQQEVMLSHPGATELMLWDGVWIIGYKLNGVMMIAQNLHDKLQRKKQLEH